MIIGVDEVGRGCLAGPVVAAAVALRQFSFKNRVDDSKKLSPEQRDRAFPEIIEKSVFAMGVMDEKTIDRVNIHKATKMAMEEAVRQLCAKMSLSSGSLAHVLIDGNTGLDIDLPFTTIIQGDSRSLSIASASILAKVTRDRMMLSYHETFPQYDFLNNKGYATKSHMFAVKKYGPSSIHRQSFLSCINEI